MHRIAFLLIFGLSGLGMLLWLGNWQLDRLALKREIIRQIDARVLSAPVDLPATPDPVGDKYLPVRVEGTLLEGEINVLISLKPMGAGYRIIAPFELADGRRIMVDRGFARVELKNDTRSLGAMRIAGNLHWPVEIDSYTPEPDIPGNIWFARDVPEMARVLGTEPVLLVARTRSDPAILPLPVDSSSVKNDHLNYAITWFSLAVVWVTMSGYFLWRTRAKAESKVT